MKELITRFIDRLYLPFVQRYIPREVFRYAACGGTNLLFDWLLYYLCFHFLFGEADWEFGFLTISPPIAALLVSSPVSTLTGFWLQKNIAFRAKTIGSVGQFFRYVLVYGANLFINYVGLKLLVDLCGFWATPSKITITVITVIFSFLMQKYFTFRKSTRNRRGAGS